jgi:trehalose 6-phosphate synthase/phosphatase
MAGVARAWDVEVMPGKANVEVRPTFINKGEITKRLVKMYHQPGEGEGSSGPVEFALCMGDDFTDEDMFRSLNGLSGTVLNPDNVFTVTVGASTKLTLARWHLLEPEDVVECVSLLSGLGEDGPLLSDVNLAAVSTVEGRIPEKQGLP